MRPHPTPEPWHVVVLMLAAYVVMAAILTMPMWNGGK